MATLLPKDSAYKDFEEMNKTRRYCHAVANCGHKLLYLVLITLVRGDLRNIKVILTRMLKKEKKGFTKVELEVLQNEDPNYWDITVQFKVVQRTCGLAPHDDECWTKPKEGTESLELLLTSVKNLRNKSVHKFRQVINEVELKDGLEELKTLSTKVIESLKKRAVLDRKRVDDAEVAKAMNEISYIIEDVRIKTSIASSGPAVDASNPNDQEQEASMEEVFNKLSKEFWRLAGPIDAEF